MLSLGSLIALNAQGQSNYPLPYNFNTFAGNAYGGNGTGSQAIFGNCFASALDSAGNIYVADTTNFAVRKITPAGIVTTLAGLAGTGGFTDGTGSDAHFGSLNGIAVDKAGNIYVTDGTYNTVRKITRTGVVTTLAGTPAVVGSTDGTGSAARFHYPFGITVDTAGNLYVSDQSNHTIRKITPGGVVTTVAGSAGVIGSADGSGSAARFYYPSGMAIDSAGNLFVADTYNHTIRKITPGGSVSTFAGTAGASGIANGTGSGASFIYPYGIAVGGTNLYVADTWGCTIRKITSAGVVTTVAGQPRIPGVADGTGNAAQFNYPYGLSANSTGMIYVADSYNKAIRKITSAGAVTTLAGSKTNDVGGVGSADGTGRAARFNYPNGVAVSGNSIYVADSSNNTIRKITSTGAVTTLAGAPRVFGHADGTGSAAQFYYPYGIAADKAGTLYVADTNNHTIRKITPAGVVTTLAGAGGVSGSADGTGSAARFYTPYAVAVDGSSNVYVADSLNFTVRKITPGGVVTTVAGLAGSSGSTDGTGSGARFTYLYGIAVDNAGNVYVTDAGNYTVRKITPAGVVTTLAGTRGIAGSIDGIGANARFDGPYGIAVDSVNNLYVGDRNNSVIRKITPAGVVTTLAGVAGSDGIADGMGAAARFLSPAGIAILGTTLYVADTYNHEIRNGVPADLKITCTDGKTIVPNGTSDTYTITVTNTGLLNLNGAVITDTFPAQVQSVTYTATGNGGATGFSPGFGNINQSLNLPPNSSVTYKATGLINGTSGTVISNTANVTVPPGVTDVIIADNKATDKDTIQ
jgi:uncharacterized repeat protein (TIGR01451 family)